MKKAALNGLLFLCLLLSFLSTGGKGVFWMEQRRRKINKNRRKYMEDTKKTVLAGNGEKDVPRAVYDGVLTIDVDAQVESMEEQEEARWHQLLNAHRTRKILTGQLGGIEKLESGWMVAVTYFNGFRIIIPMNEMMINLQGDGRENADTLNRQVRIANNMLGCDIDFIIKDLDNKSRSVVASRKDAMLKKTDFLPWGRYRKTNAL